MCKETSIMSCIILQVLKYPVDLSYKEDVEAREMTQRMGCHHADKVSLLDPQDPHCGGEESTSASCPLTSTSAI